MPENGGVIKRTEECASGENRHYEGPLRGRDTVAIGEGSRDGNGMTKGTKPVWHLLKTRDGTGVITEKDTTKCSKSGLRGKNTGMGMNE
jgi:hypothetical protein